MATTRSNGLIVGKSNTGHGAVITKTTYEGTVIARAMERAGHNPHLKGHIHEVLVKDTRNARNLLTLNGASTELTKSTTAGTVDLVTTKGGKVIERLQVKDVTSQAGIDKLVKQCADGKYRSAQLVGSEESAQVFNKEAGIHWRVSTSSVDFRPLRTEPVFYPTPCQAGQYGASRVLHGPNSVAHVNAAINPDSAAGLPLIFRSFS